MRATQLTAELLIIGVLGLSALWFVFPGALEQSGVLEENGPLSAFGPLVPFLLLASIAYVVGFFISVLAEAVMGGLRITKKIEDRWLDTNFHPWIDLDERRYNLYAGAAPAVIYRIEYHRGLARLARSITIMALGFLLVTALQPRPYPVLFFSAIFALSAFAYYRRIQWLTKTTYLASQELTENKIREDKFSREIANLKTGTPADVTGLRIVILAGGTGTRELTRVLNAQGNKVTRIVPVWDDGGSSKEIREKLDMLPVGDIRHALISFTSLTGRDREIARLFNWRLSKQRSPTELRHDLEQIINGTHKLSKSLGQSDQDVIGGYLQRFLSEISRPSVDFNLAGGSIGNFILSGAYFTFDRDLNRAIREFKRICNIEGDAYPISFDAKCRLAALLEDPNSIVVGQSKITKLDRNIEHGKISGIFLTREESTQTPPPTPTKVAPNLAAIEAISSAELIIYGPGSFYTSVLPLFLVDGVASAIAKRDRVPKIFIANMTSAQETYRLNLEDLIGKFLEKNQTSSSNNGSFFAISKSMSATKFITHLLVHDAADPKFQFDDNRKYLPDGDLTKFQTAGIRIIKRDLEDPWRHGYHDVQLLSKLLKEIFHG